MRIFVIKNVQAAKDCRQLLGLKSECAKLQWSRTINSIPQSVMNSLESVENYVDEKVDIARGEYLENNKPKDYKSKHVTKPKYVFEQLGYFNDLGNGTWYDKYQSLKHLKDFLGKHFPDCSSN